MAEQDEASAPAVDQASSTKSTAKPAGVKRTAGARMDRVAIVVGISISLVMCVMLARVAQLQARPSVELASHKSERTSSVKQEAPRGEIIDRRGRPLAVTRFGERVVVDPLRLPKPPDEAIVMLAQAIGWTPAQVAAKLNPAFEHNEKVRAEREAIAQAEAAKKAQLALLAKQKGQAAVVDEATAQPPVEGATADAKSDDELTPTDEDEGDTLTPGRYKQYLPLTGVIEDTQAQAVRAMRIKGRAVPGIHLETRPVREVPGGDWVASLIGKVGFDEKGLMGAEMMLNGVVQPESGKLTFVRDATGDPMWVQPGGYVRPKRGQDVRLSLDLEVQRIAVEELKRGVEECDAAGGRCVVVDPRTGELLAMVDIIRPLKDAKEYDWKTLIPKTGSGVRYRTIIGDAKRAEHPELARNRCVEDVYEPGSTFKPFMWAAVTELGLARVDEVFSTFDGEWKTPYGRTLKDVVKRDHMTWGEVLINSSNIGMAQGTARLSAAQMHEAVVRFGFGEHTKIGLPGESAGLVTPLKRWSKFTHTSVAMGHEVAVTPLQIAHAFTAFARSGDEAGTIPPLRLLAAPPEAAYSLPTKRVLPSKIADLTRNTMRGVTHNLDTKMAKKDPEAAEFRYEAFGKSGTAEIPLGLPPPGKKRPKGSDGYFRGQYNSSFIAGAPAEDPRVVVVVVIDDPGPERIAKKAHYGSATAGPVNRRITERVLTYMGVPPTYKPGEFVANNTAAD